MEMFAIGGDSGLTVKSCISRKGAESAKKKNSNFNVRTTEYRLFSSAFSAPLREQFLKFLTPAKTHNQLIIILMALKN